MSKLRFFQIVSLNNRLFYQQPQGCSAFCQYNWKQKFEEYQNRLKNGSRSFVKPWEFLDARGFTGSDAWLDQIQEHQPRNGTYVGAILHIYGMCI
jgi:hypothetical protein